MDSRPSRQPPPSEQRPEREPVPPSLYAYSTNDSLSPLPLLTSQPSYESASRVQFSDPPPHPESSTARLNPPSGNGNDFDQEQHLQPGFSASDFRRKKSLVRPDRERLDENHRLYNYRNHAAAMEFEGRGNAELSRTGHYALAGLGNEGIAPNKAFQDATNLRRGKSILAREEGMANDSGLSMFKRAATLRRPNAARQNSEASSFRTNNEKAKPPPQRQPLGPWMIFCLAITTCCPSPFLKWFGLKTKERQSAWREKMGLLAVIGLGMGFVGFLTFGFTASVCGTPAQRYKSGEIGTGSMVYHGYTYDLDRFQHPGARGIAAGSNPLYNQFNAAAMDGSFLFQTVNERCLDIITPAPGTGIPSQGNRMGWYFPCNLYNQWGSSVVNQTGYAEGVLCHTPANARTQFANLQSQGRILGEVYFDWADLKNETRNLGVYDGAVLDFSLLRWLNPSQVSYPALFDQIKNGNDSYRGRDITALMATSNQRAIAGCMLDTIRVGFVDSTTIGCVASSVVLYVSLVVIIGVVVLRFVMAVIFGWFISWKIGAYKKESAAQRRARASEIEAWTDDIYRPAPARYRPNVKNQRKTMIPKTSRFSKADALKSPVLGARPDSKYGDFRKAGIPSMYGAPPSMYGGKSMIGAGMRNSPPGSPGGGSGSRSSSSSFNNFDQFARQASADGMMGACPFPLHTVIPQPPADFEPFNYPLVHTILLVTAYSESVEGLRTTIDSLATTDYPNSHKVILVIADGMVKGSGNNLTTPEIALGMMRDLIVPAEEVEAHSYVAIADGHKRHNRAKIFAGFYDYDNNTVEMSKQQRVPMILVAKVGNALEAHEAKPGNRGKRDSQIVLMAFLQKVMFDERMSSFEYEFFNSLWRCTGVSPDRYETVLCVDADTKVFPDSVSRMNSCMVNDPEIMGLCGETKIANKSESWVTMIQVFEYYVSHHLTKAFESVFGGVTCLPGCFSMYRIKSPKGGEGYWVPILANPDIVEHYSENVVDTLHKKNLLLLGEDRYLSTLMLRTFPRRKMIFCPQAVCKTVVPDTFRVLLSQRRRWINSTVHNLFELFTVPDLCGVFCFSMRFVVFMELAGTLVLPAAIAFTLYLIVVTIIPGTVKPVISLILLAIILGIPGLLIVMTSRKVAYLGWMLIYLFSLPIWNFVLPAYAFLHMDDFSWGETRLIVGATKGEAHGDKDGEFDSSNIVMKRWADFERDRRYRSGMHSRDSTYDVVRSGSPHRAGSNRFSVISSAETYNSGIGSHNTNDALFRQNSPGVSASTNHSDSESGYYNSSSMKFPAQLELPAPLSSQGRSSQSSLASMIDRESASDMPHRFDDNTNSRRSSDGAAIGRMSRGAMASYDYPRYAEGYDSDELEREAILGGDSPIIRQSPLMGAGGFDSNNSLATGYFPGSQHNEPESLLPSLVTSDSHSSSTGDSTHSSASNPFTNAAQPNRQSRGVSLVDAGPVPGSEGFRVVQRQRRQSQNVRSSTRQSITSPPIDLPPPSASLPPGAAPPSHR